VARPGSRVRPLETPGNRRPREMIVAPFNRGEQNPAYRLSSARVFSFRSLTNRADVLTDLPREGEYRS
jgi:hypothetical protein